MSDFCDIFMCNMLREQDKLGPFICVDS